ncbi:unnamed protein product [Protopolystoma xenopodis]|uniref:Uncharacterized protein n=1 Tax=Protopolystoma xenopodis TaxID=117903 RepID=A0A448WV63_9PLAT|nr:unnamed protein product [Protopolystoma xenopodis]
MTGVQPKYWPHIGGNARRRRISEAGDILFRINLMNRTLEEGRVSDNFAYCRGRLGDSTNTSKRRRSDPGQLFNNRKRHRQGAAHEGQREVKKMRLQ